MWDVLSFGEALVDFFPDKVGTLSSAGAFTPHVGGAPANVAIGLARQGVSVGFLGAIGLDAFGDFLEETLKAEGVDLRGLVRTADAQTGICFVTRKPDGDRSFIGYGAPSAEASVPAESFDTALASGARVLHIGSNLLINPPGADATWRAIAIARQAGRIISCDPNLRVHRWTSADLMRERTVPLLRSADLVKLAREELSVLVGNDSDESRHLLGLHPNAVLFITDGPDGSRWFHQGRTGRSPSPIVTAVDTTGAGDAFVAGMLGILSRHPEPFSDSALQAAAEWGCQLGAEACTSLGATAGITSRHLP